MTFIYCFPNSSQNKTREQLLTLFFFRCCQNLQKENTAKYPTSLNKSEEGQWKLCLCLYFGIQIIGNGNVTEVAYLIFHMYPQYSVLNICSEYLVFSPTSFSGYFVFSGKSNSSFFLSSEMSSFGRGPVSDGPVGVNRPLISLILDPRSHNHKIKKPG